MGTLYHQRPRQDTIDYYHNVIVKALALMGLDERDVNTGKVAVTPAQWHAACDITRTALAIQSADAGDEQLAGFGELVSRLVDELSRLVDELEKR